MEMKTSDKRWLALFIITTCLRLTGGQEIDECLKEKNCTRQLSTSTILHCSVGHKQECNEVRLSRNPHLQSAPHLYPYLASVSVYRRSYGHNIDVDALNFSFSLPQADIGEIGTMGITGIMAEFMEAPGHRNTGYKNPICRFFNFSRARIFGADSYGKQIEVPYDCIGIGITPSVFHLNLTSLPSSLHVNYVVTWHEKTTAEFDYFYDYDQNPSSRKTVWVEKLIAVAVITVNKQEIIHVVFQPPSLVAGVSFLEVFLVKDKKVVTFQQTEPSMRSVTFTDVASGQYNVVVRPKGNVCDLDPNLCADITSESFSINRSSEAAQEDLLSVILGSALSVVALLVLLPVAAVIIRKRKGSKVRRIVVTSLACRELEKHVTFYFCLFLSDVLHTGVTFTLPILHPGKAKVINATVPSGEEEMVQQLMPQKYDTDRSSIQSFCSCYIVLRFSYSDKRSETAHPPGGCFSETSFCPGIHCKGGSVVLEDVLQKIPSRYSYIVTFQQDRDSNIQEFTSCDQGLAYTIHDDSEDGTATEDQVTVLNGFIGRPSKKDNMSLCNGNDNDIRPVVKMSAKEYLLPCNIGELYEDLRSTVHSSATSLSKSDIITMEYWRLALTVFQKAAENQPVKIKSDLWEDSVISDVETVTEENLHRSYVLDKQEIYGQQNSVQQQTHSLDHTLTHSQNAVQYSKNPSAHTPENLRRDLFSPHVTDKNLTNQVNKTADRNVLAAHNFSTENIDTILASLPSYMNESLSSQDSYSNLTEAEVEMKLYFSHFQSSNDPGQTRAPQPLTDECHSPHSTGSGDCRSYGCSLHAELPSPSSHGSTYGVNNSTKEVLNHSSQCSRTTDYESCKLSQGDITHSHDNHHSTDLGNKDMKEALCLSSSGRSHGETNHPHRDSLFVAQVVNQDSLPAHTPAPIQMNFVPVSSTVLLCILNQDGKQEKTLDTGDAADIDDGVSLEEETCYPFRHCSSDFENSLIPPTIH